jgi:hypothetical protein
MLKQRFRRSSVSFTPDAISETSLWLFIAFRLTVTLKPLSLMGKILPFLTLRLCRSRQQPAGSSPLPSSRQSLYLLFLKPPATAKSLVKCGKQTSFFSIDQAYPVQVVVVANLFYCHKLQQ